MQVRTKKFDVLRLAADTLRQIPDHSERAAMRAVNAVLAKNMTRARRDIASKINLPQSYIREQMASTKATLGKPKASIRMRLRAIRLARFDAKQLTEPVKHPTRSKGHPAKGIRAGRKAAGTSVMVVKGQRTQRRTGFMLPLRNAGVMGIFVRYGKGPKDIEHIYSRASPHSLFRRWITDTAPDLQAELLDIYNKQLTHLSRGKR